MPPAHRSRFAVVLAVLCAASAFAQPDAAPPNPYRTNESFFKLPEGRAWGSTSAVDVDRAGNIWVAEPEVGQKDLKKYVKK